MQASFHAAVQCTWKAFKKNNLLESHYFISICFSKLVFHLRILSREANFSVVFNQRQMKNSLRAKKFASGKPASGSLGID
jgi:hypothetical protein